MSNNLQYQRTLSVTGDMKLYTTPHKIVGKMEYTNEEYFGEEQHNNDVENIVSLNENPLHIVGKFQGDWLNDLDTAISLAYCEEYTTRDKHNDYLYITPIIENPGKMPRFEKMLDLLGFSGFTNAQLQFQRPGCIMPRHQDPEHIFVDPYRIRLLVMLAPWEYGQILYFNNTAFTEWESGTIIHTDFANTMHFTANCSNHTRPLLQITAEPGEDLLNLIKNKQSKTFLID